MCDLALRFANKHATSPSLVEISIHRPGAHINKNMGKIPSFPILYCVKFKKTPGAKSWESGSNGAGSLVISRLAYNRVWLALYYKSTLHIEAIKW